jgi:hypothetical protein
MTLLFLNLLTLVIIYCIGACNYAFFWTCRWQMDKYEPTPEDIKTMKQQMFIWPLAYVALWVYILKLGIRYLRTFQRFNAIRLALYYGLTPWYKYEAKKHYEGSYLRHALMNIGYAFKWLLFLETESDVQFEREVNNNF